MVLGLATPIITILLECIIYFVFGIAGKGILFIADSVIGRLGTDILGISGVITPGTYYNYLQNEFTKEIV